MANRLFAQPYFIAPHAVDRFRERIADIPPAEVIEAVQEMLQAPGLPVDAEVREGRLTLVYRCDYRGKVVYVPVTPAESDKGSWPVVPTVISSHSPVHKHALVPRHTCREWGAQDTEVLLALRGAGYTHEQCARIMRTSDTTIWRHLRQAGATRPRRRWTDKERERLVRLYAAGKPYDVIADKLDRSRQAVAVELCRRRKRILADPEARAALQVLSFCLDPRRVLKAVRNSGLIDELKRRDAEAT